MSPAELERIAMLGLSRLPKSGEQEWTGELAWLEALARESLEARAGNHLPSINEEREAPAMVDEWPWFNQEAGKCLEALLGGRQAPVLQEFLQHCLRAQQTVQPIYLPRLLELAMVKGLPRQPLLTAIGLRGQWLAAKHPRWQGILTPSQQDWEQGTPSKRLDYLIHLRASSPQLARELLTPLTQGRAYRELEKLLPAMNQGLSKADQAWLEALSDHGRLPIRRLVLQLLSRLPGSSLHLKASQLASNILEGPSNRVTIQIDGLSNATWLDEFPGMFPDMEPLHPGLQHQRLVKLLSLVAPSVWEKSFGQSAASLIQGLPEHPWGEALYQGWLQAAYLYQNSAWATELLKLSLKSDQDPVLRRERGFSQWLPRGLRPVLLSQIPSSVITQVLSRTFTNIHTPKSIPLAWLLMEQLPKEASPELSIAFARSIWKVLQQGDGYSQSILRSWLPSLSKLAYVIPTQAYAQLLGIWAVNPLYSTWYDPFLEQILQVLAFRKRMQQAFEG